MFLDKLNQNFCLVISCSHFPQQFYSRVTAAILPSVAIDNDLHLIITDLHHNQINDVIVKATNPNYRDTLHIIKYKSSAIFETACDEIIFASKLIEHKTHAFKQNTCHVLLYQMEKSIESCNGSYCPKLIIYFDYCNTWEDGTIEVFHNSPFWNFFLVLSNTCLSHLPKKSSIFIQMVSLSSRNLFIRLPNLRYSLIGVENTLKIFICYM